MTSVLAHGVAQKADVPIPEWLFGWGAAGALIVSFILLAFFWPKPKLEYQSWRAIGRGDHSVQPAFWSVIDVVCGLVGVFGLFVVVWAGFAGVQTPAANIVPTFVYVVFWVGLAFASVLFGDVFRAFNPWRAVARAVAGVAQLASGGSMPAPLTYPERLGRWPAVVGLLLVGVIELVYEDGNLPRNVAIGASIYSAITWIGMSLYGIDRWLDRGEAFSVYFNLFSRISPLERRDGVLGVRHPLSGLPRLEALPGTVTFVAVMIGSVTFDGFKEGPIFTGWIPDLTQFWNDLGLSLHRSL